MGKSLGLLIQCAGVRYGERRLRHNSSIFRGEIRQNRVDALAVEKHHPTTCHSLLAVLFCRLIFGHRVGIKSLPTSFNIGRMDTNPTLLRSLLTDLHFWIPVLVLLGGLAVLRWIS